MDGYGNFSKVTEELHFSRVIIIKGYRVIILVSKFLQFESNVSLSCFRCTEADKITSCFSPVIVLNAAISNNFNCTVKLCLILYPNLFGRD